MEQNNKCVMTEAMQNKEVPLDINRVADMAPIDVKLAKMIDGVYYIFAGVMEILRSLEPTVAKKFLEEFTETGASADAPTATAAPTVQENDTSAVSEAPKTPENQAEAKPVPSISVDDITKVIVAKIKQKRSNNEAIGALLKSYGVAKVSELPEDKYEAFITDLSQI